MNDQVKANHELIEEISALKQKIEKLEQLDSECKQLIDALRVSEEKYRIIAENTIDIINILDMNLRFTYSSPSVLRIRGFTVEEAMQETLEKVLTPDSLKIVFEKFAEEMALEASGTADPNRIRIVELEEYKKDGSIIWVESSFSYLRDKDGKPLGILVVSRDITDRKRADESLLLNSQRNQALLQLGQMTEASQQEITGFALEEAMRLTKSKIGYLAFLNDDESVLTMHNWSQSVMAECAIKEKPIQFTVADIGLLGEPVRQRKPVITNEYSPPNPRGKGYPEGHVRISRHLSLPVFNGDRISLVVGIGNKEEPYTEMDVEQLTLLMQGVLRLIERNRVETQLKQERDFIDTMLDSIPGMLYVYDDTGHLVRWNKQHEDMTGYSAAEMKGMHVLDWFGGYEPDTSYISKAVSDIMEKGRGEVEANLIAKDGKAISMYFTGVRLNIAERFYFTGIGIDITERKRAEETLRNSEAMLKSVFQAIPVALITVDANRIITKANDFNFVTFGYRPDELIGCGPNMFYFNDEESRKVTEILTSASTSIAEARMKKKDGSEIWALLCRSSLNTENGFAGAVVTALDITARKALEERLRQSQKMEAIGQLAGGVAHDFNNMLQAIIGYTDMVLFEIGPDDKNREKLMEVYKAGQRAAALTRQLLAFSRRQVLQLGPLDMNHVIEDVLKMLRRLIGENIELVVNQCQKIWTVNADRSQMEQVLMNLCVNARDSMPEGGRLSIETDNLVLDADYCAQNNWAKPGRYVRFSVADSGCGMDPETRSKAFEPFFTTKEEGKGTGLGLATVYGIISQHEGLINIYSEVGNGSRFSIYLPAIGQVDMETIPESEGDVPGGTETILLAEDNEQLRDLTSEIFKQAGYHVLAAIDGDDALRIYHDHGSEVDLLILDVMMPKKGGRIVYDEISSIRPDIRCLFMSGYSEDAVHTNFILDKNLNLIQKPFKIDELLQTVRNVLEL
jgi:two-component system cell cycle sensor histidine kinase/response regulator CckA